MGLPLKTVAFVDDDPAILRVLESVCTPHYKILGQVHNGMEAITVVRTLHPDVLILDYQMPALDGLEALKHIVLINTTAVVILTADQDPILARQAMDFGASGYVTKPFDPAQVIPMIETAWHRFQDREAFKKEIATLSESLESRKLLEKAKGILMQQQGFTEEEAHRTLQKMSQDQAISLKDVCRSLIQVRSLLGKAAQRKAV